MELFAAADESQLEIIKQWIDDSDVFLLILGARYGTVETNSSMSYVELEYRYAVERNMPIVVLILDEPSTIIKLKELGTSILQDDSLSLSRLKKEVSTNKHVRLFGSIEKLQLELALSLNDLPHDPRVIGLGQRKCSSRKRYA